jgi:hypothetical protein
VALRDLPKIEKKRQQLKLRKSQTKLKHNTKNNGQELKIICPIFNKLTKIVIIKLLEVCNYEENL